MFLINKIRAAMKHILIYRLSHYVKANNADLEIDIIDTRHLSSLWYGGDVATILYRNYTFVIAAIGDVRTSLLDDNDEELVYVRDKGNNARFYDEMHYYIRNDRQLTNLIRKGRLVFSNNNWWECYLELPTGEYVDLMWCLDADTIDDAVKEVTESMDDIIKQYQN